MFKKLHILLSFITISVLITVLIFPQNIISASLKGLLIWYKNVIPSLFIFMIGTTILSLTGFSYYLGKLFKNIMKPIFSVSPECAFPWITGLIAGCPFGAKVVSDLYKNGEISKRDAQLTLSFINTNGPIFIIGTKGSSMLNYTQAGYFLIFILFISSISTSFIFRFIYNTKDNYYCLNKKFKTKNTSIGVIIKTAICSSSETIIMIGGFIVLFSVLTEAFEIWNIIYFIYKPLNYFFNISYEYIYSIFSGILEVTYGCEKISLWDCDLFIKMIFIGLIIGFGGISINIQTISVFSDTDLSPLLYIISRLINSLFTVLYIILFYGIFEKTIQKAVPTVLILQGTANFSDLYIIPSFFIIILSFIFCIKNTM